MDRENAELPLQEVVSTKKDYQEPKLVDHGKWTDKTGPGGGGSGL